MGPLPFPKDRLKVLNDYQKRNKVRIRNIKHRNKEN